MNMNWLTSRITSHILDAESQIKNLVTVAASKLDAFVPEADPNTPGDQEEDLVDFGIEPTIVEFVENICNHPNTFRDFPVENYGISPKKLTPKQERHAVIMLDKVPELSKLRYKLCPGHMKEEMFWRVYFLLLQNKIGYIFSDEVEEEQEASVDKNSNNEAPAANAESGPTEHEVVDGKPIPDNSYITPDNKRKIKPRSNSINPSTPTVPQTPSEMEDYFEKIWTPSTTPVDEGIEPDYDSYFSPQRLTYEIDA